MARKAILSIEGQIDLFEYMASLPTMEQQKAAKNVLKEPVSFSDRKAQILSSAEEYLQKGERLTTLAKERFGEMIKQLTFSEAEEKLFNIKVNGYSVKEHLVPKIATTVVRPILKSLTTFDENDKALEVIKSLVDYDVDIKPVDLTGELAYMDKCGATNRLRRKSDKLLKLTLKEEGYRDLVAYGLWLNAHSKSDKNVLFKDHSQTGDIAEILAWLICFTQFNRAMLNDELKPVIEEKLIKETIGANAQQLIKNTIARDTSPYTWSQDFDDIRSLFEAKQALVGIPLQKVRRPSDAAISQICSMLGIDTESVRTDIDMSFSSVQDRNRLEISEYGKPFMYVLTNELDRLFMAVDPCNWARNTKNKLVYNSFLNPCTNVELYAQQNDPDYKPLTWPEPSGGLYAGTKGELLTTIGEVLELVFQNYKEKVDTLNYLKDTKSRAKVYQTKKNIPEKVVKVMQESVLNNYFGYVELDETCDLDKISLLADQFIAFKETYLNKVDTKKVQIRFRKLGNYKAAGLYFPHIGCLCVDVRYPDSFVHEYGHCIDNTTGSHKKNLSDESDFYRCYSAYRSAFYEAVHKSQAAKDQLKGKYNSSYYLQKTEAFARCFEMYVTRTLGVQNSICKPDSKIDFAYPVDDRLMEEINSYFSRLFATLHADEEVAA